MSKNERDLPDRMIQLYGDLREAWKKQIRQHQHKGKLDADAYKKATLNILIETSPNGFVYPSELGDKVLQELAIAMNDLNAYDYMDIEYDEKKNAIRIYDKRGLQFDKDGIGHFDPDDELFIDLRNLPPSSHDKKPIDNIIGAINFFNDRREKFHEEEYKWEQQVWDKQDLHTEDMLRYMNEQYKADYQGKLNDYATRDTRRAAKDRDRRMSDRRFRAAKNIQQNVEFILIARPEIKERMQEYYGMDLAPENSDAYWIQAQRYLREGEDEEYADSQESLVGPFFKHVRSENFMNTTKDLFGKAIQWKELDSKQKAAAYAYFLQSNGKDTNYKDIMDDIGRTNDININTRLRAHTKNAIDIIERMNSGDVKVIYKDYSIDKIERMVARSYNKPDKVYKTEWRISRTGRLYRWYTKEANTERKKK